MSVTTSRLEISRGSLAFFEALPEAEIKGTVLMVPGYTGSKEDFLPLAPFVTAARRCGSRCSARSGTCSRLR